MSEKEIPKILIAVPCMDMVSAKFAQSLAVLEKVGKCVVAFQIGSLVYSSRNDLVKAAYTYDCDYIMWFDSDMTFPSDTIQRMLKHMEDGKEIVSGLYFRRVSPFAPVLFKPKTDYSIHAEKWEGYDDYPEDGLFEIGACGFGCVMTKKTVFMDLLLNGKPWFDPEAGIGEDMAFCRRAQALGHKIYCDPSIKCGHEGYVTVTEAAFQAARQPD